MKVRSLFGVVIPLVLGTGCYSHTAAMARQPVVVAPVSRGPETRVYPETAVVPAGDVEVAMGIRRAVESNPALKAAMADADIEVNGGAVTLRGAVPTEHDRETLRELVTRYPGVHTVEDHLHVELR
jgi:osmotically-inducible protein OsmY